MSNCLLAASNRMLPALVTPLTSTGELDVPSAERLIDHLYRKGVGGLYLTGSTGEGIWLDANVRREIVELAVHMSANRGTVVVHIAAVQSSLAMNLADHAARVGADAVSSIPPFAGGYNWGEVYEYYSELCINSPLPVVAYYIPGLTGQAYGVEQLATLLELPNLVGFKSTESNLYLMQRLLARFHEDQIMYNGCDELLSLAIALGAHGGIGTTYNFMPDLILEIDRLTRAGNFAEAIVAQKQANEVIEMLLAGGQGLAASKQILYWQGLIDCPACVAPRAPMSTEAQLKLRRALDRTFLASSFVR